MKFCIYRFSGAIAWANIVIIALCLLSLTACRNESNVGSMSDFDEVYSLSADSIKIEELLSLGSIYRWGDKIVLKDRQENPENQFYVYSDDMKLQYAFGKKGPGPLEFMMPTVVKNTPDSIFQLRDHMQNKFATYALSDSGVAIVGTIPYSDNDGMFGWEINYVGDDNYLMRSTAAQKTRIELKQISTGEVLDTLSNPFDLNKLLGNQYYSEFDDCWIAVDGDMFATAYYFMDLMCIGRIRDGKMELLHKIGTSTPPEFHLYTDQISSGKYSANVEYNIAYYTGLDFYDGRIYALYAGIPWGEINGIEDGTITDVPHSSIHVYGKDRSPICNLELDRYVTSFVVVGNRIYAINPTDAEDYIYTYVLPFKKG